MMICDAQVHIWGANTPERPWPEQRHAPHRPVPFSKDDLLREMDAAGVHRAVIVPPSWGLTPERYAAKTAAIAETFWTTR